MLLRRVCLHCRCKTEKEHFHMWITFEICFKIGASVYLPVTSFVFVMCWIFLYVFFFLKKILLFNYSCLPTCYFFYVSCMYILAVVTHMFTIILCRNAFYIMKRNNTNSLVTFSLTEKFQFSCIWNQIYVFTFTTVSSFVSMVSGQNIAKLEIIQSINIVDWLK